MPGFPRPEGLPPMPFPELVALADAAMWPARAVRSGGAAVLISGVTHDSSAVRAGDLFAALPGSNRHGVEFAPAAAAAGAAAILTDPAGSAAAAATGLPTLIVPWPRDVLGRLADQVYGQPSARLPIVGITGTAGKTSTAYLIEAGLRAAGRTTAIIGTVETRVGDLVIDSVRTTPEAPDLHALLAVALQRGVEAVVMEVSSHAMVLRRVDQVRFAIGGFTNLGADHLDFHADLEEYFAAKAQLFDGRCAVEIVNLDDPAGKRLLRPTTLTYSATGDPAATWRASAVTPHGYGQSFTAHGPDALVVPAGVGLPGRHNVANALLAVASLVSLGVDPAVAGSAVAAGTAAPGRMERVEPPGRTGGPLGVVDYAHKPDAIVEVLAALRTLATERGGRLICVIGAGGNRDRGKRPVMGRAAAQGADLVIVTDDNPRTEDPAAIRAEVLRGALEAGGGALEAGGAEVVEVGDRRAAIVEAVARAGDRDVLALLGKGHERGQEIAGRVHPFDDRDELAAALGSRR